MHKLFAIFAIVALAACMYAVDKPVLKTISARPTSPVSGQEMFSTYCAVCHGTDAKGDGPAVPALKKMPPDLTLLTRTNDGRFPELRVYSAIQGDANLPAHGSKEMPVWGVVFRSLSRSDTASPQLRLRNLTTYIESLQAK